MSQSCDVDGTRKNTYIKTYAELTRRSVRELFNRVQRCTFVALNTAQLTQRFVLYIYTHKKTLRQFKPHAELLHFHPFYLLERTLHTVTYITTHSQTPIFCIVSRVDKWYL